MNVWEVFSQKISLPALWCFTRFVASSGKDDEESRWKVLQSTMKWHGANSRICKRDCFEHVEWYKLHIVAIIYSRLMVWLWDWQHKSLAGNLISISPAKSPFRPKPSLQEPGWKKQFSFELNNGVVVSNWGEDDQKICKTWRLDGEKSYLAFFPRLAAHPVAGQIVLTVS